MSTLFSVKVKIRIMFIFFSNKTTGLLKEMKCAINIVIYPQHEKKAGQNFENPFKFIKKITFYGVWILKPQVCLQFALYCRFLTKVTFGDSTYIKLTSGASRCF